MISTLNAPAQADAGVTPILRVRDLVVEYPTTGRARPGPARAVDGVSLEIAPGRTLGLVGESGCGKTTLGRAVLGLVPHAGGTVEFDGVDVNRLDAAGRRRFRREAQIIFQDPGGSLDPRMRARALVAEPLVVHRLCASSAERAARVAGLLERCGLDPGWGDRYPHEFSGGQRQRLAIARALATNPKLLICDEPTSSLDVSVQAQILNLLCDLRCDFSLSMLFISHDLGVIQHVSDRIAVMRDGRIVEAADRDEILSAPRHPYTRALLATASAAGTPA